VGAVAVIAFKRMKRGIPPYFVRKVISGKGDEHIVLLNGAVIRFKSAEVPDNLYGEDVWAAVLDEASRMRADAFYAIRSTLTATRGPLRIIGNVKGRKNWFFLGCRKAEGGEPGHCYHRIPRSMPSPQVSFRKRNWTTPAGRCRMRFTASCTCVSRPTTAATPFGMQFIRQNIAPLSHKPPSVFGADLAKSVDWTVLHALDADGVTCAHHRFQLPWKETRERIRLICGGAPTVLDSTGVGDPIVEELQRTGSNFQGYKFSQQSKQKLMEGLAVAIQSGEVQYPDGSNRFLSLRSFEYEYARTGVRYSAPEGQHDDTA
jgi:hypothetical protein